MPFEGGIRALQRRGHDHDLEVSQLVLQPEVCSGIVASCLGDLSDPTQGSLLKAIRIIRADLQERLVILEEHSPAPCFEHEGHKLEGASGSRK